MCKRMAAALLAAFGQVFLTAAVLRRRQYFCQGKRGDDDEVRKGRGRKGAREENSGVGAGSAGSAGMRVPF